MLHRTYHRVILIYLLNVCSSVQTLDVQYLSGTVFDYLSRGTLLADSILQIPKRGLANITYPLQLLSGVFQGKVNICNSIVSTPFACYSPGGNVRLHHQRPKGCEKTT